MCRKKRKFFKHFIIPYRNELVQHKRKNDELASYIKKQKIKYHGVRCSIMTTSVINE